MREAILTAPRRTFASLYTHRNYRLFFSGQVVSMSGTWMQNVATAWLVLELTGSPVAVGVLAVCQFLPFTLLSLFAGVLLDRLDARRTVIGTQAASMVLAAALAALTLADSITSWHVFLITALRGVVLVLDNPARQALTFRMVGPAELANAVALNSSLFNAARVVGPALGGVVVATAGPGVCFALNAATFLAVLGGLVRMRENDLFPVEREDPPGILAGTGEAFASIGRSPVASVVLAAVFLVTMFSFNFNVLLPVLAKETLTAGPAAFGVLSACFGGGALVGALAAASLGRASRNVLFLATAAFGLAQLLLAPQTSLGAASFLLAATGAAFTLWSSNANSTLQLAAPDHLRGRWLSFYYLAFNGSMPLGGLLAGWLAARGGTGLAFTVAGAAALATAAGALLFLKSRRLLGPRAGLGADDVDRRPDLDLLEEPLGVGDRHANAPVRHRVAERGGVGRTVNPDGRRRDPHPARPERVPGPGRNRLQAFRPFAVRRVPGRVPLLHDDLEGSERSRILCLARRDGEGLNEARAVVEVEAVRTPADDDDRPVVVRRGRRGNRDELELDLPAPPGRAKSPDEASHHRRLVDSPARLRLAERRCEI